MTKKKKVKQPEKYPWLEMKREYISDPQMSYAMLHRKYGASSTAIKKRALKENWSNLRAEIVKAAEQKMISNAEVQLKEMKQRHLKYGKILQRLGLEAIQDGKYVPKSAKEARQFITDGVRMEREALGADKKKDSGPAIVNIVAQERDVISRYLEDPIEGEIVEDGKKSV